MYPPLTTDDSRQPGRRTWGGLLAATAPVVAGPFALWAAANRTAGALVLVLVLVAALLAVVAAAARRRTGGAEAPDRRAVRSAVRTGQ
jgi:hypothetical protein